MPIFLLPRNAVRNTRGNVPQHRHGYIHTPIYRELNCYPNGFCLPLNANEIKTKMAKQLMNEKKKKQESVVFFLAGYDFAELGLVNT